MRWFVLGCCLANGLVALTCMGQPPESATSDIHRPHFEFIGNASCATTTCHGNVIGQGPAWNHSLSTFLARDPHAGAGTLLRDPDSRAIVTLLDPQAKDSATVYDNVLRTRCISCHATATPSQCQEGEPIDDVFLAQGVSCEACHGPAQAWLQPHVRQQWSGPERFEPETGMIDTESVLGRAETCVRCHVGSRSRDGLVRDMNHDLIAAGHPALRFDLLIYNENLPHHWDRSGEVAKEFNRSAIRVRDVGRRVNLAAAAALTSQRASSHLADPTVPWPELADYDCFACHQSLSMDLYRTSGRAASPLRISSGLPIWNAWHTIGLLTLDRDRLLMLSPHRSDPQRVKDLCQSLAQRAAALASERVSSTVSSRDVLRATLARLQKQPPADWNHAAIDYLALDAAIRDLAMNPQQAALAQRAREGLRIAERLLRFQPDSDGRTAERLHSPSQFDPESFQQAVLNAFDLKPSPAEP